MKSVTDLPLLCITRRWEVQNLRMLRTDMHHLLQVTKRITTILMLQKQTHKWLCQKQEQRNRFRPYPHTQL